MSRLLPLMLMSVCLVGCPWIPDDVHDQFNGDDDDDSDVDDDDDDVDPCETAVLFADADQDGFGSVEVDACDPPPRTADVGGDCNDSDGTVFPGAAERCDGIDNDCDSATTEAGVATFTNLQTGAVTDLTGVLANTPAWAPPAEVTEGELALCSGEFSATIIVQTAGQHLDIVGDGAAVLASGSSSDRTLYVELGSMSVDNLTVVGGARSDGGGSLVCVNASLDLTDVVLRGGTAPFAGGLSADGCTFDALRTEWTTQTATASGDGAYFALQRSSVANLVDNTFSQGTGGTAVLVVNSALSMTDTDFDYNTSRGVLVGDGGQFTANGVDFPTWSGSDVVTGSSSLNLGADFTGFCNANGCVAR